MIGRKNPFGKIEYKQSFLFQVKQQFKAGELYKIKIISPSGASQDSILEGRSSFYSVSCQGTRMRNVLSHLRLAENDLAHNALLFFTRRHGSLLRRSRIRS